MNEETAVFPIRLLESDVKVVQEAATKAGVTLSEFVREALAERLAKEGVRFSGKVNPQGGKRAGAGRRKAS